MYVFMFILWLGDVLDEACSDVFQNTQCAENSGYKIGIALVQKMEVDYAANLLDEDMSR